jgi:hypothetical protein
MKISLPRWTCQAALLALFSLFIAAQARALDILGPDGTIYTGISDNTHYSDSYSSANLFDENLIGVTVGTTLSDGNEYATASMADGFVAFQLDQNYTNIASVFYAQRGGSNPTADKIQEIDVWSSASTPFAAADPGTTPNEVVSVTNSAGAVWSEYPLTNIVSGQYFLVKFHQNTLNGNPGGREFRFGANLSQPPGALITPLADKSVYVGGSAFFSGVVSSGTAPLVYSWTHGSTVLVNGGSISGATTGNLVISNVALGNAGVYTLTVSNSFGSITASANLSVLAAPTEAVEALVIADKPVAYYQLNESSGPTAFDLVGTYNGVYGGDSLLGVAGPQPPTFPGFSSSNTAVQTTGFDLNSAVTLPPLNLTNASTTNAVSIVAWIYPDDSGGPQQPYTGIVFCRGAGTAAGMICSGDGTQLAYQWNGNRYAFNSSLVLPANQWTLVALVYTTNFTTLYMGSSNGIVLSAVDNYKQTAQTFAGPTSIGLDTDVGESARTFNGSIDDVSFFNRALSSSDINAMYAAGVGINPTVEILNQTTNDSAVLGDTITLTVTVSGLNPVFQWYKNSALVSGATNASFTVTTNAMVSDAGNYYVVASNQVNSVTSAVINVVVANYSIRPLSPTGSLYTNLVESGEYPDSNFGYTCTNLFDTDLTGVPLGTVLGGGDWAISGPGPAYLAFQVDKSYVVNAVYYAQRSGSDPNADKIDFISLWTSTNTPFDPLNPPGTPPDAEVAITDPSGATLDRYVLPATITGQYFLLELEQNPVDTAAVNNNIGGKEFRLGVPATVPVPLVISQSGGKLTLTWPSGTLQQSANASGPYTPSSGITSGVPFTPTSSQMFYRIQ